MKITFSILFAVMLTGAVYGHCGSCGVGDDGEPAKASKHHYHSKHMHSKTATHDAKHLEMMQIPEAKLKKVAAIQKKFDKDYRKLKKAYIKKLEKVLSKKELESYMIHHMH